MKEAGSNNNNNFNSASTSSSSSTTHVSTYQPTTTPTVPRRNTFTENSTHKEDAHHATHNSKQPLPATSRKGSVAKYPAPLHYSDPPSSPPLTPTQIHTTHHNHSSNTIFIGMLMAPPLATVAKSGESPEQNRLSILYPEGSGISFMVIRYIMHIRPESTYI